MPVSVNGSVPRAVTTLPFEPPPRRRKAAARPATSTTATATAISHHRRPFRPAGLSSPAPPRSPSPSAGSGGAHGASGAATHRLISLLRGDGRPEADGELRVAVQREGHVEALGQRFGDPRHAAGGADEQDRVEVGRLSPSVGEGRLEDGERCGRSAARPAARARGGSGAPWCRSTRPPPAPRPSVSCESISLASVTLRRRCIISRTVCGFSRSSVSQVRPACSMTYRSRMRSTSTPPSWSSPAGRPSTSKAVSVLRRIDASNVPPPRSYTPTIGARREPVALGVVDGRRLGLGDELALVGVGHDLAGDVEEQVTPVRAPERGKGEDDLAGLAALQLTGPGERPTTRGRSPAPRASRTSSPTRMGRSRRTGA